MRIGSKSGEMLTTHLVLDLIGVKHLGDCRGHILSTMPSVQLLKTQDLALELPLVRLALWRVDVVGGDGKERVIRF